MKDKINCYCTVYCGDDICYEGSLKIKDEHIEYENDHKLSQIAEKYGKIKINECIRKVKSGKENSLVMFIFEKADDLKHSKGYIYYKNCNKTVKFGED